MVVCDGKKVISRRANCGGWSLLWKMANIQTHENNISNDDRFIELISCVCPSFFLPRLFRVYLVRLFICLCWCVYAFRHARGTDTVYLYVIIKLITQSNFSQKCLPSKWGEKNFILTVIWYLRWWFQVDSSFHVLAS